MTTVVAIVTAFLVGFAMKYGGLCTYAAALQIVRERRAERLMTFLAAAAWTTLTVIPLAWFWPGELQLSMTHDQWGMILIGGWLLGLGAWLNRGCVFGTFVQLTGGNLTYGATLAGLVAGAVGARHWLADVIPVRADPALATVPGLLAGIWMLAAAAVLVTGSMEFSGHSVNRGGRRLRPVSAILIALTLGVGGGGLFAAVKGWDFAAVLVRSAYHALEIEATGPTTLAVYCTFAMVAGGVIAAVSQKHFSWQTPKLFRSLASFAGGVFMGLAAVLLPGGNDGLLLSGLPAFAPHALVGYGLMLASMLLLLVLMPNHRNFSLARRA